MHSHHEAPRTVSGLLRKYTSIAVAEATGRSRTVAHSWRTGRGLPDVASLPRLAAFLEMELDELTRLVADESSRTDRRLEVRRAS
ncbi:MAG: hypothetical protein JWN27_2957 [Candidatus Eremiobacteraeota bacterium]|nr:hypothetical protein [Candidatus Eremiobacteraeota bacterium]